MPWFWSDEIANVLFTAGKIDERAALSLVARPVAFRDDEGTLEEASERLFEDDEVPLAA